MFGRNGLKDFLKPHIKVEPVYLQEKGKLPESGIFSNKLSLNCQYFHLENETVNVLDIL